MLNFKVNADMGPNFVNAEFGLPDCCIGASLDQTLNKFAGIFKTSDLYYILILL